jgi:hypothetical protein
MTERSNNYAAFESEISQWMATGATGFEEMAMRVFEFQRIACPEYGRFCTGRPQPRDWREIPAVPVEVFRRVALRAFEAERTIRIFRTSGTTGEGFGEHHFCSLSLYEQSAKLGWVRAGLPMGRVVAIIPTAAECPHSSLSQMASWLTAKGRFFFGEWERLVGYLGSADRPVLFGTALAFLDFFEWLGQRRLSFPAGSLAVETGGYKGSRREMPKEVLYDLFESKLGLPSDSVWNEYGMTELSSQFYSRGFGVHSGPPWCRGRVVDPVSGSEVGEGQTGVLQIFDIANLGSVSAIRTRDLAIRRGEGFDLLGRDPAALPRGCSRSAEEMLS